MYSSVGFDEFHLAYDENSPLQPQNTEVARCLDNRTSFIWWAKCRQVVIHDTYEASDIYPKPYCIDCHYWMKTIANIQHHKR